MSDAPNNPPAEPRPANPPHTPPPLDAALRGRCMACGFDLGGLEHKPNCPECGRDAEEARSALLARMRRVHIGARAARGILICVLLALLLGAAAGLLVSVLPERWHDLVIGTIRALMFIPMIAIVPLALFGIWNMATPPLPSGGAAAGAWVYPLARWCAIGAGPLWIAAGLSQSQSVELAGILTSCGVLFVGAAMLALFRIRADIARLLAVTARARTGLIGHLLMSAITGLMLSIPLLYAMSAFTAIPRPTYNTLDAWTAWAFILGIEYNGYTMLRTLEAAGLHRATAGKRGTA
ncbi:MAG: hypothetical protein ACTS3F_00565 [Phycisphaerales bacterium]